MLGSVLSLLQVSPQHRWWADHQQRDHRPSEGGEAGPQIVDLKQANDSR
jgi:hypothetical protein